MADRRRSPSRRRRACAPCTKAKARCKFNEQTPCQHLCERCERLSVECTVQRTKSMRRGRQIRPATQEGDVVDPRFSRRHVQQHPTELQEQRISDDRNSNAVEITNHGPRNVEGPGKSHQGFRSQPDLPEMIPPLGLSWHQVTLIFDAFKTRYLPSFPFVLIRDGEDISVFYEERPFLLRAIILVAAPLSVPRIAKMKRNVLAYLSQQVFVEDKKTLDLLQGVLICAAWSHGCQISDEQVTNLMHLALGYAHNLGITKVPKSSNLGISKKDSTEVMNTAAGERKHSPDEQRALLGCFCILSTISYQSSRKNPMDGLYPDMCRAALAAAASTAPANLLLDRITGMVQFTESFAKGLGEPQDRDKASSYAFLLEGNGRRFRTELDRLAESNAHPDLAGHQPLFELYHHYLTLRLYEPAITVADGPEEGAPPSRYRALCLSKCLNAAKSFLDLLLAQPADSYLRRSIITAGQTSYVMFAAARVLLINAPDWDVVWARQALDLDSLLDRMTVRVTEAEALRAKAVDDFASATGMEVTDEERRGESKLVELAQHTRWLREWFDARIKGRQMNTAWSFGNTSNGGAENLSGDDESQPSWWIGLLGNIEWNLDGPNV